MARQPIAPREKLTLCRICSRPDYLEHLCYNHYRILELANKNGVKLPPEYSAWQQDQDTAKHQTKDCGCPWYPEDYHGWNCALNDMAEVGEEHIFDERVG